MKTKPFILVFPIEEERDEVENYNGNVYTRQEVIDIITKHRRYVGDILMFDLDEFVSGVNNQDIDILTESWICHVNIIEEER